MLNKSLNFLLRSSLKIPTVYYFSSTPPILFQDIKASYLQHRDMVVFNDLIIKSNNVIDNINFFKIFKVLEENKGGIKDYQDFYYQLNIVVTKKSDNVRMLMAKVKARVAKLHEENKEYYDSISNLEQGLSTLEDSLVPPFLLYYQIYRYYGFLHYKVGDTKKAVEALTESVEMIEKYLNHSDDVVASNENTKNQAKAFNTLAILDLSKSEEWLQKANRSWQQYDGNKFQLEEYLQTIILNTKKAFKSGRQKGEQYLMFNLFQLKKEQFKDRLKKVRQQIKQ